MATTATLPFDAARHLGSPEAQAELLSDALGTGDAGYIANALAVIARARGLAEASHGAEASRDAARDPLRQEGDPSLTALLGVVRSLGLRLSVEAAR